MGSSDAGPGTDAWSEFLRRQGLDEGWEVRFTAAEARAREMAEQYRAAGFRARVLPLSPGGGEPETEAFDRFEGAGHDPLRGAEPESCAPCLGDTWLLVTRPADGPAGNADAEEAP